MGLIGTSIPLLRLILAAADSFHRWIWFVLANLLSLAGVCPFVGSLSDLMGRRNVALVGATFLILGMIVCSTAKVMNVFIGKLF